MGKKRKTKSKVIDYKFSYFRNKKTLTILNVALILTALVLFSFLIGAKMPTLGKAAYWLDKSVPVCVASFEGEKSFLNDVDICCAELQKQLKCDVWNEIVMIKSKGATINKKCYVGTGTINYLVNNKQYNYCKKEGYLDYKSL
tara:strand:+ start:1203 stop:1631 length:429 start_codon:yes stop_codon:yes gene_type:complete